MSRNRTVLWKRVIFALLSALTMAVIFAFSSQTGEEPSFVSGQVGDRVEGIFVGVLPSFMLDYLLSFLREGGARLFILLPRALSFAVFLYVFLSPSGGVCRFAVGLHSLLCLLGRMASILRSRSVCGGRGRAARRRRHPALRRSLLLDFSLHKREKVIAMSVIRMHIFMNGEDKKC